MAAKSKQPKLVQVHVHVNSELDIQKVISQLHTYVARSKMQDRIEVKLSTEPGAPTGEDLL